MRNTINLIIRLLVAGLFIISGIAKYFDYNAFASNVSSFGIINDSFAQILSVALISFEIFFGIMLFLNIHIKPTIYMLLTMMTLFIIFVLYSLLFNKGYTCKCFGAMMSSQITLTTLVRNIVIVGGLIYCLYNKTSYLIYDDMRAWHKYVINIFLLLAFGVMFVSNRYVMSSSKPIGINDRVTLNKIDDDLTKYLSNTNNKYTLLFVFKPDDCMSCLDEALWWNKIPDATKGKLNVFAIGCSNNKYLIEAFKKHKKLNFPLFIDSNNVLLNKHTIITPAKILLDSNKKIVHIQRSYGSESAFNNYMSFIKKEIGVRDE